MFGLEASPDLLVMGWVVGIVTCLAFLIVRRHRYEQQHNIRLSANEGMGLFTLYLFFSYAWPITVPGWLCWRLVRWYLIRRHQARG